MWYIKNVETYVLLVLLLFLFLSVLLLLLLTTAFINWTIYLSRDLINKLHKMILIHCFVL